MNKLARGEKAFGSAVIISLIAHTALFLLILVSPSLSKSSQKGMIHYVNLITIPGGGGGGGGAGGSGSGISAKGGEELGAKKKETLRDLATSQKLQEEPSSKLRHPVEKPKKENKTSKEKKSVISQSQKDVKDIANNRAGKAGLGSKSGSSAGTGLRIGGVGEETEPGSEYASQIGLSHFPFTYYLQIIMDRVSANWFTSLVDPGISGTFHSTVYFKIHRNGQISDLKIDQSSGIRSLDLSAQRAIQSSAPFPPLPREYEDEYLVIRLIFEHSK